MSQYEPIIHFCNAKRSHLYSITKFWVVQLPISIPVFSLFNV